MTPLGRVEELWENNCKRGSGGLVAAVERESRRERHPLGVSLGKCSRREGKMGETSFHMEPP